ncbi:MAG: glycerophosphodiester phosphodiesterase [Bdellovibrio sp.]|nr:MAG: glycerophosphodiester phosphodiesterase [Bdellovibrio sp.]
MKNKHGLESKIENWLNRTSAARSRWMSSFIHAQDWNSFPLPRWQAHRGYWKSGSPQNSLASLIEARQRGAEMAEFDVRLTRDRIPILFHDAEIAGQPVEDLRLSELLALQPTTTLQEALSSREVPAFLNIELKSELMGDDALERYVTRIVEECGAEERILFSSFNPFSVWKIANYLPAVPRALLVSPDLERRSLREFWFAPFLRIHLLHLDERMLSEEEIGRWSRLGVPLAAWTVNDPDRIKELWDLGVRSVITDIVPRP